MSTATLLLSSWKWILIQNTYDAAERLLKNLQLHGFLERRRIGTDENSSPNQEIESIRPVVQVDGDYNSLILSVNATSQSHNGCRTSISWKVQEDCIGNIVLSKWSCWAIPGTDFQNMQKILHCPVNLSYQKHGHVICIFTDDSDAFWAKFITQISKDQCKEEIYKQANKPMVFVERNFMGSQITGRLAKRRAKKSWGYLTEWTTSSGELTGSLYSGIQKTFYILPLQLHYGPFAKSRVCKGAQMGNAFVTWFFRSIILMVREVSS